MKELHSREIIHAVKGEIVQGQADFTVTEVIEHPSEASGRPVFFHMDRKTFDLSLKDLRQCLVITDSPESIINIQEAAVVKVGNIREAYYKFIAFYRSLFSIPVVAVTGTCGKTTTKEMIKHILEGRYTVQATYKSRNSIAFNQQYLLGIDDGTDAAVFETGVASPGNIVYSCRYFMPTIGIITTIGYDHLSGCGSFEKYLKAKAEILQGLNYEGALILNADDANIAKIDLQAYKGKIIYFGLHENAQYQAVRIKQGEKSIEFVLRTNVTDEQNASEYTVTIPGFGVHTVYNALAAIAASLEAGIELAIAISRLADFCHLERRLQVHEGMNQSIVLEDSFSSNPTSVKSALEALKEFGGGKQLIAVLGRMSSLLGEESETMHREIGALIAQWGFHKLITRADGDNKTAELISQAALDEGMQASDVFFCESNKQTAELLRQLTTVPSVILVKSSTHDDVSDLIRGITIPNRRKSNGKKANSQS